MIAFTPPGSPRLAATLSTGGAVLVVDAAIAEPQPESGVVWRSAEAPGVVYVFALNATTASIVRPLVRMAEAEVLELARLPIESGERIGELELTRGLAIVGETRAALALDPGRYTCVYDEVGDGEHDARRCHVVRIDDPTQASLF